GFWAGLHLRSVLDALELVGQLFDLCVERREGVAERSHLVRLERPCRHPPDGLAFEQLREELDEHEDELREAPLELLLVAPEPDLAGRARLRAAARERKLRRSFGSDRVEEEMKPEGDQL